MYNINQNVEVREFAGVSAIPVGINEGCKLTEINTPADKNGNTYLQFIFEDASGNQLKHNEFAVNPQYVTPKTGETQDEAVTRRINAMLVRIKHICTQFVPAAQFNITGNTFGELCNGIKAAMANTNYASKSLRLKVTYDYKDYASLPGFPPFVEDAAKETSGLKINPRYDKMEPASKNATAEVGATDQPDLPF
tara:strand:+ start:8622 stop:9203 length:582 start_codon:yes stop_codon:yes gene_type:complete